MEESDVTVPPVTRRLKWSRFAFFQDVDSDNIAGGD
jgi:hypothetical protein